jgi:hypothetical protein
MIPCTTARVRVESGNGYRRFQLFMAAGAFGATLGLAVVLGNPLGAAEPLRLTPCQQKIRTLIYLAGQPGARVDLSAVVWTFYRMPMDTIEWTVIGYGG